MSQTEQKTASKGPRTPVRRRGQTNADGRGLGVPFVEGYDPRRAGNGNRNPAWSIMRWIEELCSVLPDGKMKYPVAKLTLLEDGDDHLKAAAAGIVMRIRKGAGPADFSKAGIPLAANDLDRIFDRFVGKPVQATIAVKVELGPSEAIADLRQLFRDPQIAALARTLLDAPDEPPMLEGEVEEPEPVVVADPVPPDPTT